MTGEEVTVKVHTIRLPNAVGVEQDPDRPGEGRLVVYGTDDLHRLRAEIDIVLYGATAAAEAAARSDSIVARSLLAQRSPFELGTGPCPKAGCTTPGDHVHRPGQPATVTETPTVLDAHPVAGETAASTEHWLTADWITWLRSHGVSQLDMIRELSQWSVSRGEVPVGGIEVARLRPELRAQMLAITAAATAARAQGVEPW